MADKIYLLGKNEELHELNEREFKSEDVLQELLAKYPKLLSGGTLEDREQSPWLLISRELAIPDASDSNRWSLDHLFLDHKAVPTLVEVKRSTDTRIRREVVGQLLDYAANAIMYWPIEHIMTSFEKTYESNDLDPSEVLNEFLGDLDQESFWSQVKTNLQAGKVRLVFVADKIPIELQRIVEFLNVQMDPAEVLAIEVKRFQGRGAQTLLVPKLIGQTAEAVGRKSVSSRVSRDWDERSFFEELRGRRGEQEHNVAKRIYNWSQKNMTRFCWGHGLKDGSCIPVFDYNAQNYWPFSLWTYGRIEIQFQYLKERSPFDSVETRMELLNKLNGISGISIPEDSIEKRPSIKLSVFKDDKIVDQLLSVYEWILERIKGNDD